MARRAGPFRSIGTGLGSVAIGDGRRFTAQPTSGRFSTTRLRGAVWWKLLVFLVGVMTATAAVLIRPVLRAGLAVRTQELLNSAEDALNKDELSVAADRAREAYKRLQRTGESTGPASMTLGIVRARQADRSEGADRLVYLAAATQHLTDAARSGVRSSAEPGLYFELARCLHSRGQFPESIRLLRQSLANYPQARTESLRLLTLAYLDASHLDLPQAQIANLQLLQEPGLTDDMLRACWRTRSEILRQLGKQDQIADLAVGPGDQRWAGLLARASDRFQEKDTTEAVRLFTTLGNLKGLPPTIECRVWYMLALASREVGDMDGALAAFRQLELRFAESPESYAGAAFSAAILLNRGQLDQAIAALNRAAKLSHATNNETVPLEAPSLSKLLVTAIHKLRSLEQYEQASTLIDAYRRIAPRSAADQIAIQLYESWAEHRVHESNGLAVADATEANYQAEELYRKAGALCVQAAESAADLSESNRWLWQASTDFMHGNGHVQAAAALERLLDARCTGDLRARALALWCAALESSGKTELVPDAARQCVEEFPGHPAAITARYYLARYYVGFGEPAAAEEQLRLALEATTADADPQILERCRLVLAHILCDEGREDEAVPRLNEIIATATERDAQFEARLLLGECLHRQAQQPAARAAESQTEHAKSHYNHRKEAELDRALSVLSSLQRELAALLRADQLTDLQLDWLRRCRWGMADCLYEAERIEEALSCYQLLAEAYPEPADWFAAQLQIANCHVRLNRIDSAVAVIRDAHLRLGELPPDARDQARIGMAPERWKELLDWAGRM